MLGRPKKNGKRYPCGQLVPYGTLPTQELQAKRIAIVGVDNWRDQKAGYLLGILELRGYINEEQKLAGDYIRQLCMKWSSLAGLPYRHAFSGGMPKGNYRIDDPEEFKKVKEELFFIRASIVKETPLRWKTVCIIEGVCLDDKVSIDKKRFYLDMKILKEGLNIVSDLIK